MTLVAKRTAVSDAASRVRARAGLGARVHAGGRLAVLGGAMGMRPRAGSGGVWAALRMEWMEEVKCQEASGKIEY